MKEAHFRKIYFLFDFHFASSTQYKRQIGFIFLSLIVTIAKKSAALAKVVFSLYIFVQMIYCEFLTALK